jgi:DNA-binding NtrC family response regulator
LSPAGDLAFLCSFAVPAGTSDGYAGGQAATLLVVDDDLDVGDTLAEIMRFNGYDVDVARNGREGLRMVGERHPDLVLADVEMPQLSGPDMVQLMAMHGDGEERIPVVFLSGIVGLDRISAEVGTPYYLSKPYEIDDVLSLVERALTERTPPRPRGVT